MRTLGNVLWFVLNGIWMAIAWVFLGLLLSITIVLIPFGRQCFKLANFVLWPFGRTAVPSATARRGGTVGNVLWFIPGVFLAVGYAVSGVALCLTIIGIPFGIQSFKFIPLALFPFGKEIVPIARPAQQPRPANGRWRFTMDDDAGGGFDGD